MQDADSAAQIAVVNALERHSNRFLNPLTPSSLFEISTMPLAYVRRGRYGNQAR